MMDIEYRRDMNHNYMIVKGIGADVPDDYETKVISTNRIPGLLTCRMQYIDAETWYSYDVTSLQRLTVFCESRKIGRKELVRIMSEILRILEGLEDYLLDFQHLILLPSCICMDFETMEIRLMYVPFYRKDIRRSLRELMEYLLGCTDHSDQAAIILGYRFCHEVQENYAQLGDLMGILMTDASGLPGWDSEGENPAPLPGKTADMNIAGTDSGYSLEEMRKNVPSEAVRLNGMNAADIERGQYRGNAGRADSEEKGILSVMKSPSVLVVIISLMVFAAIYVLLHTGVLQYVSIYTLCGICAAICAVALAMHLIKNKKRHKDEKQGDRNEKEGMGDEHSVSYKDDMSSPVMERTDDTRSVDEEDSFPGSCADGAGEMTAILSSYRPEAGPEDRWLLPATESQVPRHLTGDDLLIGKQQQYVDMVIDSPTVSRIHARLRFRAGRYFLEDLNSRNGTTLNGEAVSGNEEKVLNEGDVISFADVSYIFSRAESLPTAE